MRRILFISVILAGVVLGVVRSDTPPRRPTATFNLARYADRELTEEEKAAVAGALHIPRPDRNPFLADASWPEWVFSFSQPKLRYAVVGMAGSPTHPGHGLLSVRVISDAGKPLTREEFSTGHRLLLAGIAKVAAPHAGGPELILLGVQSAGLGPPVRREYFGLDGDRAVLVRLEDENGHLVRNGYWFWVGPDPLRAVPLKKLRTEVRHNLQDGTWAGKLAVVSWLAAEHHTEENTGYLIRPYGAVIQSLRSDRIVTQHLCRMAAGEDPWLRDAAKQVLTMSQDAL